jgi:multiple sugar transport system permease protein
MARDSGEGGRSLLSTIAHSLAVVAIVVFVLAPVYVILLVSFSARGQVLLGQFQWVPHVVLSNYDAIFSQWRRLYQNLPMSSEADFVLPGIRNSFIVAVPVACVNVVVACGAGYAFARLRFPGQRVIALGLLATQMVPALVLMLPLFVIFERVGLSDSLVGVMIADLSITLPFTIWIVSNAVDAVPVELDRASRVDGTHWLGSMVRVTLPLAKGGILTAGLIAFLFSWNDLIYPLILVSNPNLMQLQPAVAGMYTNLTANFGIMTAATVVATIPAILIAALTLRPFIRGLLSGAVKG